MTTGGPDPLAPFDRPPGTSPWAPGGDPERGFELRAEPAPPDPVVAAGSSPIVFDSPADGLGERHDGGIDRDGSPTPGTRRRGLVIGGAVVTALAVAVGVSLVIPDTDLDGGITATPADEDTVIDTSDPQVGPATDPEDTDDAGGEVLPGLTDDDVDPNDPDGDGIPLRVDVPEPLASITSPTEIVALTSDGLHVTVSLPSGGVRVAPHEISPSAIPDVFFNSSLLATPSFSVFSDGGDLVVVDRLGDVSEVPAPALSSDSVTFDARRFPIGWSRTADGTEVAIIAASDFTGLQASFAAVTAAGDVTPLQFGLDANVFEPVPAVFDDGAIVLENGGLIVRRTSVDDSGGAIATGDLLAGGTAGSVVRRCDAPDVCVVELIDETGQPIRAVAPTVAESLRSQFFGGAVLSPSGEHVLVRGPTGDVPPNQSWVLAIRLDDGEATPIVGLSDVFSGEFPSWLADGSMVVGRPENDSGSDPFPSEPGVQVVPLDPEVEPFRFAEEIGTVLSVTTRFPDAELPVPAPITTAALEGVPLAAIGLPPVIVADTGGRASRIDFSTGEVTSWRATLAPGWAGVGGAQVIPRDREGDVVDDLDGEVLDGELPTDIPSEVVVINRRGDAAITIVGDEVAVPPDWPSGERYPYNLKLIWAAVPGESGAPATYQLVDHQSVTRSDARVPVSDVIGSDGEGGLVHRFAGDVWVSDFDTTTRLTSGEVWAMNDTAALVWECDDDLVCDQRVVDRTTGERRATSGPLGRFAIGATPGRDVTLTGTLSPDRRWALVELSDTARTAAADPPWGFVELETGRIVATDAPDPLHPVIWSDDGEVAVFVSQRRLRMFDAAAFTVVGEDGGLGGFDGLAAMGPALS